MFVLGDPDGIANGTAPDLAQYPKIATLDHLRRAGIAVPAGMVMTRPPELSDIEFESLVLRLRPAGRLILRSVLPGEDGEHRSFAGIATSISGINTPDALRQAVAECVARLDDDDLKTYIGDTQSNASQLYWLLQREIERKRVLVLLVDCCAPVYETYVESFDDVQDPFARGVSPTFSGTIEQWNNANGPKLARLVGDVIAKNPIGPTFELEVIEDLQGNYWCVQQRERPPHWQTRHQPFLELATQQLQSRGQDWRDYPQLELDAEHNPELLSPAHAWLMHKIAELRPTASGDPVVLNGCLYVRKTIQSLSKSPAEHPTKSGIDIFAELCRLRDIELVIARKELASYTRFLESCGRSQIDEALARGMELCLQRLDLYVQWLIPLRRRRPAHLETTSTVATTLLGREDVLDILPTRWDIAAPSLEECLPKHASLGENKATLPADEASAWNLLVEWDDHLFSLGIAPLRHLWLRVAKLLSIETDDVFFLAGDDVLAWSHGDFEIKDLRARILSAKQDHTKWEDLDPPLQIQHGKVKPELPGRRLRGFAFGDRYEGVWSPRRDLDALILDPPAKGAVVGLPALTAPAAVVLHRMGIKAIVTEHGGLGSHGARMAQELGLSALIGCRGCMDIPAEQRVFVDTKQSRLRIVADVARHE